METRLTSRVGVMALLSLALLGGATACGGATESGDEGSADDGGGSATGGSVSGGTSLGGAPPAGGSSPGGAPATGGASNGGAATAGAAGAPLGGVGGVGGVVGTGGVAGGGATLGCYVAVQVDDCCSEPIAADTLADPDPCRLPYQDIYSMDAFAGCPAAEACMAMDCTWFAPVSRVATRDETGSCVFADECDPANVDCLVATDHHRCCACPEVLPNALVAADPCVVEGSGPPPAGAVCADCSTVDCGPCSNELLIPDCGYGDPPVPRCYSAVR